MVNASLAVMSGTVSGARSSGGRVDFDEPENFQCRSCARCVVELYVPRLLCRNSWLRWVSQNASELTRSPLQLSACEFGVTIELEQARGDRRSALFFSLPSGFPASCREPGQDTRSGGRLNLALMICPDCGQLLGSGELDSQILVLPRLLRMECNLDQ